MGEQVILPGGPGMSEPVFFYDRSYKGSGLSEGLARGVQVKASGQNMTQEGMGLGAIAVRSRGHTYFSSCSEAVWVDSKTLQLEYLLDTMHLSGFNGVASPLLTRIREEMVVWYRRLPALQKVLLWSGTNLRRFLRVKGAFAPVPPLARALVRFRFDTPDVEISCNFTALSGEIDEIYIMNELGADYFDRGWKDGSLTPPPSGWESLEDAQPLPFLHSPHVNLGYSICCVSVDRQLPFSVYWGWEKSADLRWAGFIIEIRPKPPFHSGWICSYKVIFAGTNDD